MGYEQIALLIFLCIITLSLNMGNCSEYAIQSKQRLKRNSVEKYVQQYDMNDPPKMPPNGSFHKNRHGLPEKAIYCTSVRRLNTDGYSFLRKYYLLIQGNPGHYTNDLECVYPRSVEFPELGDEIPTTPKPILTGVQKFQEALLLETSNFREFLNQVDKGEKPKPYQRMDIDALTNDIMNDIFHRKPDPLDTIEDSAPNGIICEHLKFNETDVHSMVIEKMRPICYPAHRPPPPPTTTPRPTTTTSSDIYDKACYILCHTGALYQLLPCCRK